MRLETISKLRKLFTKWGLRNHFQNQKWEIGDGMWLKKMAMHKVYHAKALSPGPRVKRQHYRD